MTLPSRLDDCPGESRRIRMKTRNLKPSPLGKVPQREAAGADEVLPQYGFAESISIEGSVCCTSPDPFGATFPIGEGIIPPK